MSQDWETERTIEPSMALRLIQEQFPQLKASTIKLLGGWDYTSFAVDETWIFRFPRRQIAISQLQSEWCALPKLVSRLPIAIPHEEFKGNPSANFPWPFTGYRKISGTSACSIHLADAQREQLAEPIAYFLKALHATPIAEFTECRFSGDHKSRIEKENLTQKIQENFKNLARLGLLKNEKKLEELLYALQNVRAPVATTLVHGDFYARHMLLDERFSLTGVIDWGDIHIGDPAIDLAVAHSFLPVSCHEKFKKAYGNISNNTRNNIWNNTWNLAKLRALLSSTLLVLFGHHIHNTQVMQEGLRSLEALITEAYHSAI